MMRSKLPMHRSPRCGARTRNRKSCQAPAMPNGRCRMHGGLSPGAPKGNKNALKHGRMMGELTASLAHEITQPIATARNNARAATRFLDRNPPDLGEVREALECIVGDADRAGDIIDRIRDHIKKAPPRKGRFDLNKAINEVIALAESAITTNGVSVRTRLAEALLPVQGIVFNCNKSC